MKTDYVSLKTAKLMKEVGFNTKHEFVLYDGEKEILESYNISLWSAAKWLREKHGIDTTIHRSFSIDNSYHYCITIDCNYDGENQQMVTPNRTYEQALDTAIQVACKLIKNK